MEGVRRQPYWLLILVTLTTRSSWLVSASNEVLPGRVRPVTRDCEEAWECCRFPTTSQEYNNCCLGHGCCPSCVGVSKGCWYNSMIHMWGSVVSTLPEVCLNLVCAATLTPIPPYLTANLVLVPWDPQLCQGKPCNVGPNQLRCVDHTGLERNVGDVWSPDRCHRCRCVEGNRVECQEVPVRCPVRPHPSCVEVPAPCCPNWNCTSQSGCTDENGSHRDLYSAWQVDECTWHVCTQTGVQKQTITCPPKPSFNCRAIDVKGECCPQWQCGLDCSVVSCPADPPGNDCQPVHDPLSCCPSWNCSLDVTHITKLDNYRFFTPASGCYDDDGVYHELHSSWQPDPCTTIVCSEAGLKTIKIPCLPPPHQNCQAQTKPGQCCPTWNCGDDCSVLCPPPPHSSCTPYKPPLACCNEWNCSGCVDAKGNLHPLYSQWQAGPCMQQVCLPDGIVNMTIECPSPPHHNCQPKPRPGHCCPEWKCKTALQCRAFSTLLVGTVNQYTTPCPAAPHTTAVGYKNGTEGRMWQQKKEKVGATCHKSILEADGVEEELFLTAILNLSWQWLLRRRCVSRAAHVLATRFLHHCVLYRDWVEEDVCKVSTSTPPQLPVKDQPRGLLSCLGMRTAVECYVRDLPTHPVHLINNP
ncbi:hypothetical protein Pmani_032015 [Petrolisthes manimaculis]|uniref:VWFC domain-containing protein n=1 Tax=Petrolisthes manimaculis TaxID=1843537 RepID=A0AAE1NSK0_9EUCA|nr:hypothetical protein Pmani_032015 [Petrolisthes manimaculis]